MWSENWFAYKNKYFEKWRFKTKIEIKCRNNIGGFFYIICKYDNDQPLFFKKNILPNDRFEPSIFNLWEKWYTNFSIVGTRDDWSTFCI